MTGSGLVLMTVGSFFSYFNMRTPVTIGFRRFAHSIYQTTFVVQFFITIVYWALIFDKDWWKAAGEENRIMAIGTHGGMLAVFFLDISLMQMTYIYGHYVWLVFFIFIYCTFNLIMRFILDEPIYKFLTWTNVGTYLFTLQLSIAAICLFLVITVLTHIRYKILHK